ncbi:hypothetical protein X734_02780 [Mesorhizobium sp. L2C084A000]|nr:hypothetical protein X734_02780 [Mesorhizobium sp. L2C084A000]
MAFPLPRRIAEDVTGKPQKFLMREAMVEELGLLAQRRLEGWLALRLGNDRRRLRTPMASNTGGPSTLTLSQLQLIAISMFLEMPCFWVSSQGAATLLG